MPSRALRTLLVALAAFAGAGAPVWAKREIDYVPPPYGARILYALIGVIPLAAVLLGICALGMRRLSVLADPPIRRFLKISGLLVVAGCLFAALDGLNDELWDPWFGAACFVAFAPAVALYLGAERPRRFGPLALAAILTVITWFALVLVGQSWQYWAFERGFPVSW